MGKRQVMNLEDCDVIFDDNQSICQECHIGHKRVYCITTKWEKHEWAKDYRQSECPPLVYRTSAAAVKHFCPCQKRNGSGPCPKKMLSFSSSKGQGGGTSEKRACFAKSSCARVGHALQKSSAAMGHALQKAVVLWDMLCKKHSAMGHALQKAVVLPVLEMLCEKDLVRPCE